jgi:hypothetical protein
MGKNPEMRFQFIRENSQIAPEKLAEIIDV